jgi:DNA invertase Pin-like site-specific DNA recombinase
MPRKTTKLAALPGYVTYLRTSDEDAQAPERSQAAQRRDIEQKLLRSLSLPILGEYIDNYTGTSADRKSYQRMLTDARAGKFSHVFASVPDRFGRDDVEALRAIDEMTKLGIVVRFASHPDLDPADADDRLYLNILFGMAKRESAVTARRVKGGMASKLLSGGWSWRAPDGYLNKEVKLTELGTEEQLKHARYKRWIEIDPEQAKVWRYAWELLLTDRYTLDEICEKLHEAGYRTISGRTFIKLHRIGKTDGGEHRGHIQLLSKVFHNWIYAGWVVIETEWVNIPPKTIRGDWEPMISTEDFERGLAILAQRRTLPMPSKKHFYVLQGLIYLEREGQEPRKLTCSTPNANRARGGVPYYCIMGTGINILCRVVDDQLKEHLKRVQIDPSIVPDLRKAYVTDITRFTRNKVNDRKMLEVRRKKLEEKELNLWRAFTDHGMRPQIYESLTRECNEERLRVEEMLRRLEEEQGDYIGNLDAALAIISQIGEKFAKCTEVQQRAILLQMVERVIVDAEGWIKRLELKPPFHYLIELGRQGGRKGENSSRKWAKKPMISEEKNGSIYVPQSGR